MIGDYLGAKISDLKLSKSTTTCSPTSSLGEVIKILKKSKGGSIIIVENQKPVGIFTERDYLLQVAGEESTKLQTPISKFMTKNPKSVLLDSDVREALGLMRVGNFRHLVVVDEKQHLVSVLSIKDVLYFLVDFTQSIRF
jgi:CBS domain-containing protein